MAWLGNVRIGLASAVLVLAGCVSSRPGLAGGERAAGPVALAGTEALGMSRLQKPEGEDLRPGAADTAADPVAGPPDGRFTVRRRAMVNEVAILDDEVRNAAYPYLLETLSLPEPQRTARQTEIFTRELDQLIEREVILQDAIAKLTAKGVGQKYLDKLKAAATKEFDKQVRAMKERAKVHSDEELKAFLARQGLTLEAIRRQLERNFMAMEYMKSRVYPMTDIVNFEMVREYYNQHPEEFQRVDSVKWQDICVGIGPKHPTREDARRCAAGLVARARAGEDFAALSAQFDEGDSALYRNGEGYGQRRGEIKPPEVEAVLFQMHDGDVAEPVEVFNGFHVVRLVKREYAGLMDFDQKVQAQIKGKLKSDIASREFKRIVKDLKSRATIVIDTEATP
jgi:parvulin-like peptidyl-prolyl isomerase